MALPQSHHGSSVTMVHLSVQNIDSGSVWCCSQFCNCSGLPPLTYALLTRLWISLSRCHHSIPQQINVPLFVHFVGERESSLHGVHAMSLVNKTQLQLEDSFLPSQMKVIFCRRTTIKQNGFSPFLFTYSHDFHIMTHMYVLFPWNLVDLLKLVCRIVTWFQLSQIVL